MLKDKSGILSYTLGVRSLDGSGPQKRGLKISAPRTQKLPGLYANCEFKLSNTGKAALTEAALHPQAAGEYLKYDIYRVSVSVEGPGWSAQLPNALVSVKFGESVSIPVYVARTPDCAATAKVTLTGHSESDPTKTATATCKVAAQNSSR
jgi:hypothetical protein